MKVNIIGAGRTGKTLAKLIVLKQAAHIQNIFNTSAATNAAATAFIQQGKGVTELRALCPADITLITTPDDLIKPICTKLTTLKILRPNSIVIHTSGTKSSDALAHARELNCAVASAHPLKSFADPNSSITTFAGTYCALEGDRRALCVAKPLLESLGAQVFFIDKKNKARYHAAGVFASNYLVTLHQIALACLHSSGVEDDLAKKITESLMQGTLANLHALDNAKAAFTGPINRGDMDVIQAHLDILGLEKSVVYSALAQYSLPLTNLTSEQQTKIKKMTKRFIRTKKHAPRKPLLLYFLVNPALQALKYFKRTKR